MSKLSFRARALDPSKPMPIYLAEELPDLPEYSAINRAVPQMPSGMEKEEESEHHLQRAICAGLIIPTPEVFETECEFYDRSYPNTYKMPRQMIHMQPLNLEQDIPDYDMDSGDESWVNSQSKRLDLSYYKFEQMMDRLEKSSGQTVVTLNEAKALLKQDDEVSIAVYDYWLHKRLKTQHPLILTVKTENKGGIAANSPYLAFRRRTEKMQTRKNRKNDEASYEKMLKLRRDLSRAVTLLEMIKKREKTKREQLHLTIEVVEKRYQARDYSGQLQAEYQSQVAKSTTRPAFAPLYSNQYSHQAHQSSSSPQHQWSGSGLGGSGGGSTGNHLYASGAGVNKRDLDAMNGERGGGSSSRKEKRQYKKRKHKHTQREKQRMYSSPGPAESMVSSEEEDLCNVQGGGVSSEDEGPFGFKRNKSCQYNMPVQNGYGNWPWTSRDENGSSDPRYRFTLTSLAHPRPRCIGFARRRIGRGGRVIIDRMSTDMDELWSRLDYKIFDSAAQSSSQVVDEEEVATTESGGCVVSTSTASTETQKRLLDLRHLGSNSSRESSSNINSSSNTISRDIVLHNNNNGRVVATTTNSSNSNNATPRVVRDPTRAVVTLERFDDVIKSESAVVLSDSSLSKQLLDRHSSSSSSNVNTLPTSNQKDWHSSLDHLSSGYASQQSLITPSTSLVDSSAALLDHHMSATNAHSLRGMTRMGGGELTRSLSLPMSIGTLAKAFQDVSGSPAVLRRSGTMVEEKDKESSVAVVDPVAPEVVDCVTVDNEDDMSLAELARKSGPGVGGRNAQSEDELFAMIRKEWLHFRPKAKESSPLASNGEKEEESCLPKISSMAPLNLEVVTLRTDEKLRRSSSVKVEAEVVEPEVDLPSSIFLNSEDNMFQPAPFALDELEWREGGSGNCSADSSLVGSPLNGTMAAGGLGGGNLLDQSLSGDSLNELSLNLGDDETGEDNEKVLENILQECQMADFKILEDPTIFGLADTEDEEEDELLGGAGETDPNQLKSLFDRAVGYESEFVSWALESFKTSGRKRRRQDTMKSLVGLSPVKAERAMKRREVSRRRRNVGKSRFKLSRVTRKDETFSPSKMGISPEGVPMDVSTTNGGQQEGSFMDSAAGGVMQQEVVGVDGTGVVIKQEPEVMLDDVMAGQGSGGVIQVHEIKIEKQEDGGDVQEVVTPAIVVPMGNAGGGLQQSQQRPTTRNIIFQGGGTNYLAQQGENTIILTSNLNSVKNHHINGPLTDKTMITTNSPNNKSVSYKRQLTPGNQSKLNDSDLIPTGGLINNGSATVVAGASSGNNHKFSLTPVGANATMAKTISIAGQPGGTGNKYYFHTTSVPQNQQQQQITLTSACGGSQGQSQSVNTGGQQQVSTKSLQYLTPANIKFNFSSGATAGSAAGQTQDIKSILASSNIILNDHGTSNMVQGNANATGSSSSATGQQIVSAQNQSQQQRKTMNVFVDGEKRFLYTNNRGQFVAQLNPTKMVNIVPVQGGTGTTSAGTTGQPQQVLATGNTNPSNTGTTTVLNSNTKIITTTTSKGTTVQQQQSGSPMTTRGFQTVQRMRPVRNSTQQQQLQNAIAKHNSQTSGGGNEVRTFNRILIQPSAQGTGNTGISGGDPNGGGGGGAGTQTTQGGSGGKGGGAGAESSINVNAR